MKKICNESLYDLKNISELVNHNGYVYFTETGIDQKANAYQTELYRLDIETGEKIPFGNGGTSYQVLALSPDRTSLTFLGKADAKAKSQIYQIPLAGGSAIALTQEEEGVSYYVWSKDGKKLYYQTLQPDQEDKDSEDKDLLKPKVFNKVRYQWDGRGYVTKDRVSVIKEVDLASGQSQLVLESDQELSLAAVVDGGNTILYNQSKTTPADFAWGMGQVVAYDRLEGKALSLTDNIENSNLYLAAVSPDESHYLLVGNQFDYQFVSQDQLYLYEVATASLTSLTKSLDRSVGDEIVADFQQGRIGVDIRWLNDEEFVFSVTDQGRVLLYQGHIDGSVQALVEDKIHVTGASCLEGQKSYLISYSKPSVPSRLAILEAGNVTDLYEPNQNFLAEHSVVEPEGFTYKGYADWDVQGWYLAPLDGADKHPAILYIHGGPQVCYGESFFHEMQVLAGRGYGVIMLNPCGGSSYGQDFVAAILGDYGNHDYDDLMLGLDYVLNQHPEIDRDALYVAGGSYGGFMTNWIVGHTDRFKAACTQRSISNWLSFYGASDIGPFFVGYQLQADLTQADKLWAMSPLAHAHKIKTPLLVLHGEEDRRCPLEQGQQIYMAAQEAGVDTKLITFPASSHGLSRDGLPNLRIKRLEAIQDWFQTH